MSRPSGVGFWHPCPTVRGIIIIIYYFSKTTMLLSTLIRVSYFVSASLWTLPNESLVYRENLDKSEFLVNNHPLQEAYFETFPPIQRNLLIRHVEFYITLINYDWFENMSRLPEVIAWVSRVCGMTLHILNYWYLKRGWYYKVNWKFRAKKDQDDGKMESVAKMMDHGIFWTTVKCPKCAREARPIKNLFYSECKMCRNVSIKSTKNSVALILQKKLNEA